MQTLTHVDWSRLPQPEDDGAADHLTGLRLPDLPLRATDGRMVNVGARDGTVVIYAYPMTGPADGGLPEGWDMIPGARGCTPQSCAFRDHMAELRAAGADHVFGLSTQDTAYQAEAAARLHLPFPLISDVDLAFATALQLPVMQVAGRSLIRRITLIARDGCIKKVFYPVFPPDRNVHDVLEWLGAASRDG